MTQPQAGLVVASHGRHYLVETDAGERLICHPRGKKASCVVGDRVWWQRSEDEGRIERVEPRRNLLYRQDELRTKSFAANLDRVLILLAAEPVFSETQLARALIAARAEGIEALVALNKRDLGLAFDRAWQQLEPYRRMGYAVLPLALRDAGADGRFNGTALLHDLQRALDSGTTLVLGPSGAGKSTLINRLVPDAMASTGEVSQALGSGRHTTTTTTWYWVDRTAGTALIDSPGFQEFGLRHLPPTALAGCMPDFAPYLGQCRFYNCTHLHEPGCAVISAVESGLDAGGISARRYKIYSELYAELAQPQPY